MQFITSIYLEGTDKYRITDEAERVKLVSQAVQKWCEAQKDKKFERKFWSVVGSYSLPLYLHGNVPPNCIDLYTPKPEGINPLKLTAADLNINLHLDIRHFIQMIDREIFETTQLELNKFPNILSSQIDLDDPEFDSERSRSKTIFIKTLARFSAELLKKLILFDWNSHTDYPNALTIFTDTAKEAIIWCSKTQPIFPKIRLVEMPDIFDLTCYPTTRRVRRKDCLFHYSRIQTKANAISSILNNLGLKHPVIFGTVSEKLFVR